MIPITLLNQLNGIEHVKAIETESHTILVTNALANFDISLNPHDISDTNFVISPTGERVQRISMNQGGIIVTPDDYVFRLVRGICG